MIKLVEKRLREFADACKRLADISFEIGSAACQVLDAVKRGNKVLACGNGGSASQAEHFIAELVGRYKAERRAMAAISLTGDSSVITAVANDYGYAEVFARQVRGIGSGGDVLVGFSTSGNSKNVVKAFETARSLAVKTIGIVGGDGGELANCADYLIKVPSKDTARIQELHLVVAHLICEIVDREVACE